MLSKMKIVTRLFIGFIFVFIAFLVLGFMAIKSVARLSDISKEIFEHPFTVSTAILECKNINLLNDIRLRKLVHSKDPVEAEKIFQDIESSSRAVDKKIEIIKERFLGDQKHIADLEKALKAWRESRFAIIALCKAGRRDEAVIRMDSDDEKLAEAVFKEADDIIEFARGKATDFKASAAKSGDVAKNSIIIMIFALSVLVVVASFIVARSITSSLRLALNTISRLADGADRKIRNAEAIGSGNLDLEIVAIEILDIDESSLPEDDLGKLLKMISNLSLRLSSLDSAFAKMASSLKAARDSEKKRDWIKTGLSELNVLMRGDQEMITLASNILNYIAQYLGAGAGALYIFDEGEGLLKIAASYAMTRRKNLGDSFRLGEGITGQAAIEKKIIIISNVPSDYMPVSSATGESRPLTVTALPLAGDDGKLAGVLELAIFRDLNDVELDFLAQTGKIIAIGFAINIARQEKNLLLQQSMEQTEELRVQQEELQQNNVELEERTQMLEHQREQIRVKNKEIEASSEELRKRAEELERISSYKSEFLANMSHELRTPLNSLLILSGLLRENKDGNLTPKQVEYSNTINAAGADLLNMINDILDLSKIESGKLDYHFEEVSLKAIINSMESMFRPAAEHKGLYFSSAVEDGAPEYIRTDEQRTVQIMRNLLSNAMKFTLEGGVDLSVRKFTAQANPLKCQAVGFTIKDTGIGIPADKLAHIFLAFTQADGTTSRKFGGTGLGLAISLQLAKAMEGIITVSSHEGKGSEFTLFLPFDPAMERKSDIKPTFHAGGHQSSLKAVSPDNAKKHDVELFHSFEFVTPEDNISDVRSILVIEDDVKLADILKDLLEERGYGVLLAGDGEIGFAMANQHQPLAIILDVMLPGMDGWQVMQMLKENPRTRHIPVHFLTCLEEKQKALSMGAVGFMTKPVTMDKLGEVFKNIERAIEKSVKKILVVEDDDNEAKSLVALLDEKDVSITVAGTGKDAIDILSAQTFDAIVLDLGLEDMSGFDLLEHMRQVKSSLRIPVIIHSGRDLNHEDEKRLRNYADSIIIKGAKSPERLLNEVSLFLHLMEERLSPDKQRLIRASFGKEAVLEGKKAIVVDDDMRNLFSLTSILSDKHMKVLEAENGRSALDLLSENPDTDIVLMDVMMPEMDGHEAIRAIRMDSRFKKIPIIAMTAKALKGDQEKCIEAGASDYISKPIDVDKLMSLLRVWLYRQV